MGWVGLVAHSGGHCGVSEACGWVGLAVINHAAPIIITYTCSFSSVIGLRDAFMRMADHSTTTSQISAALNASH